MLYYNILCILSNSGQIYAFIFHKIRKFLDDSNTDRANLNLMEVTEFRTTSANIDRSNLIHAFMKKNSKTMIIGLFL